jgi:intracellular sulfur oxidation DsrE/DsrF family protein
MDELPGTHRAFIDSSRGAGGADALNYANNILTGHSEVYGGSDADYAMIVCFRHMSTPLGYNDAIWAKYGEGLSRFVGLTAPGSDQPLAVNPMNIEQAAYGNRGTTLATLAGKGVQFAICSRATQAVAGMLARSSSSSFEEIHQELISNNIPNSRFVPAGVLAATRAQEYGYSLLFAAG